MRHYEIVLLVHPGQSEQVPAMIDRYKNMVTSERGQVHRVEDWGRRRLAYMIDEVHKAHYVMLNVECSLETLRELEKNFRFNDSIIRNLVIRRDQAIIEQSAMATAKAEEDRLEATKQRAQPAREDAASKDASADAFDGALNGARNKATAGVDDVDLDEVMDEVEEAVDEVPSQPEVVADESDEKPVDKPDEKPSDKPDDKPTDTTDVKPKPEKV